MPETPSGPGTSLATSILSPLTSRWAVVASPAIFGFWLAGAAAYSLSAGSHGIGCGGHPTGVVATTCRLDHAGTAGPILLGVSALAILIGSAALANVAAWALANVLIGRWWPTRGLLRHVTEWRVNAHTTRRRELAEDTAHPAESLRRYQHGRGSAVRPTAGANLMLAVSSRAAAVFGLELSVCWGPFVAVLDDDARAPVGGASTAVVARARTAVVAFFSAGWAPALLPWPWATAWMVSGVLLAAVSCRYAAAGIADFTDAVFTALLLHRSAFYRALGLELPKTSTEDVTLGQQVSAYLSRTTAVNLSYAWPPPAAETQQP